MLCGNRSGTVTLLTSVGVVCLCIGLGVVGAVGQSRAPGSPAVEPKADEIFKQACAHLAAAKQFSFQARDWTDQVLENGLRVQYEHTHRVVVRRPDHAAGGVTGDLHNRTWWYNGKTLAVLDKQQNTYATLDVPANIDAMFDHVAENYGLTMPLCDLLFSDPYQSTVSRVHNGVYVGLHQIDGARCHHLAFRQAELDWQVWVQEGNEPLLRKVVITYKDLPGSPQFIALLDHWNLSDKQPDDAFTFTPPASAQKVELKAVRPQPTSQPAR